MEEKVYEYLKALVAVPGISDTDDEKMAAERIGEILKAQSYFQVYPENFGEIMIPGDAKKRPLVYGLVRGNKSSGRTVIFTGHYDVVGVEDYGPLKPLAFSMEELKAAFEREYSERMSRRMAEVRSCEDAGEMHGREGSSAATLRAGSAHGPEEDFWKDVVSGEWIFGRGAADMKGGLAAGLAVLDEIGEQVLDGTDRLNGNILFLVVPDEESYSAGMRGAAGFLMDLREREGLSYDLLIDLEPMSRDEEGQEVFLGSVGKCMPVVLVQGRTAHVSRCFDGINAVGVLGRMFEKTELSAEFAEMFDGEVCMPPTWLNFRDRKREYDVSVPARAAGYLNVLSFRSGPEEIIEKLRECGYEAFSGYIDKMEEERKKLEGKLCGRRILRTENVPEDIERTAGGQEKKQDFEVLSFAELAERCREKDSDGFERFFREQKTQMEQKIQNGETNYPQATIELMTEVLDWSGITTPLMVLGFAPPLYPAYHSDQMAGKEGVGSFLFRKIKKVSENAGCPVKKVHYFTGISDLSYCGVCGEMDFSGYASETPLWGDGYRVDFEEIGKLNIPAVLLGPWGKDIHRRTERVNRKSLLVELPEILLELAETAV